MNPDFILTDKGYTGCLKDFQVEKNGFLSFFEACRKCSHKFKDKCPELMPERVFKNSEYAQEIPQTKPPDNPIAPRERAAQPSRDTRKTN